MLDIFVVKNKDLSPLYLQDDDWLVVNNMIKLLKPIFIATKILSTSTYSTISDCMIAESINFKLQEYWKYINDSTTIELYKNNTDTQSINNLQTRKNKQTYFESLISEQDSVQVPVEDEIVQYLALPVDSTTNPLDWWHHFSEDFSTLARMALCYLSIQGSSVSSEQAFSVAANMITKIRYNLKPDTAYAAICLKSWIQQ
ncbi:21711_t:CDS:2, partial [Cetraspora pellucida]